MKTCLFVKGVALENSQFYDLIRPHKFAVKPYKQAFSNGFSLFWTEATVFAPVARHAVPECDACTFVIFVGLICAKITKSAC